MKEEKISKVDHSNIVKKGFGLPEHALKELETLRKEYDDSNDFLKIKNIDKVYENGFQAVFGSSFGAKKGEFISLLGPSGCGKTTTLRIIAGLEHITRGQILINNINHTHSEPSERDLTMVFQNYALFPHMSVRKNLEFGLRSNKRKLGKGGEVYKEILFLNSEIKWLKNRLRNTNRMESFEKSWEKIKNKKIKNDLLIKRDNNFKKTNKYKLMNVKIQNKIFEINDKISLTKKDIELKENLIKEIEKSVKNLEILKNKRKELAKSDNYENIIKSRIETTSKLLGLEYFLSRKPSILSGGQRQRVALGRSIVSKPKLFLMDEPLSNLDAKLRATMRKELREIHDNIGAVTLYVTHDQIEAMTMSDKVVVMSDGFIQQIGTPKEIYSDPSNLFVASFVGNPSMNLIKGKINGDKFISNKGLKIPLPKDMFRNVKNGQKVVFGLRPHDFMIDKFASPQPKLEMKVNITGKELLGHEIQYTGLELKSKEEFTWISSSYSDWKINEDVITIPILTRAHLFDLETSISLTSKFNYETLNSLNNWVSSGFEIDVRRSIMEREKLKSQKISIYSKIKKIWKERIIK